MKTTTHWVTGALMLLPLLAPPAEAGRKRVLIVTDPPGAFVRVNDQNLGNAPVSYTFEFGHESAFYVSAIEEGYDPYTLRVDKKQHGVKKREILLVLHENPAHNSTATSPATNKWLRLQVSRQLEPEAVWQKLIDSVTDAYPSLEQIDVTSGYLRSIPKERLYQGADGDFLIRTQLVAAISSREPLVYKMKIQSETRGKDDESWEPYERVFKQDAQLIEELQNRLGTK